jgi:hypothetical protein
MERELSLEEMRNCEGLLFLTWDMFDSPDSKGSGYKFMEREPVLILDEVVRKTRMILTIEMGYVTKTYGDNQRLVSIDSHRVGKAIRIRIVGHSKRMKLVKALILEGVTRIALGRETVYFDTDDLKPDAFYLW